MNKRFVALFSALVLVLISFIGLRYWNRGPAQNKNTELSIFSTQNAVLLKELKDFENRIGGFRSKIVAQFRDNKLDVEKLKKTFEEIETEFEELIKKAETNFKLFDDESYSKLENEVSSLREIYGQLAVTLISMASAKAILTADSQGYDLKEWLKRFRIELPSKIFQQAFGGYAPIQDDSWGGDFYLFAIQKASLAQGDVFHVQLNPHYLAALIRSLKVTKNVDEAGLFAIAHYLAMDRLQMAWSNLKHFRGDEDHSPLPYTQELLARYQDLPLSDDLAKEDQAFLKRKQDLLYLDSSYRKIRDQLPKFHDESYFDDIKKILYIDSPDTPEDQRSILADAFAKSIGEVSDDLRLAHFLALLDQFSLDVSLFDSAAIKRAVHLLLVRSYISADVASFTAELNYLRANNRYLDEDIGDIKEEKVQAIEQRIVAQGAKYLSLLEESNVWNLSKEAFLDYRHQHKVREKAVYMQKLVAHARKIAGKGNSRVHMPALALALQKRVEQLNPNRMVKELYNIFASLDGLENAEQYYLRTLIQLQDNLDAFLLEHSVRNQEEILTRSEQEDTENAIDAIFEDIALEDESSPKFSVAPQLRSSNAGLIFIFDDEGKLVYLEDEPAEEYTQENPIASDKPIVPFSKFLTKKQLSYLTPEQRTRLTYSYLEMDALKNLIDVQIKDLEDWKTVGEILGFRGENIRFSNNLGTTISAAERGSYNKHLEQQLLSDYPFLALKVNNSKKKLYEELADLSDKHSPLDPAITAKVVEGFDLVEAGLIEAWDILTSAKSFEDLEYIILRNPLLSEKIKMAFPEYVALQEIVAQRLQLPGAYEQIIGAKMKTLNTWIITPLFTMQIARWVLASRLPTVSTALLPIIQSWQASIPGFYWGLWGADFIAGQAVMIADTGLGFRIGWGKNGPTLLPSELIETTDTFFFASVKGFSLIDPVYYEGIRAEHMEAVKQTYIHLALDTYIFGSIVKGLAPQLKSFSFQRSAQQ